MIFSIYVNWT